MRPGWWWCVFREVAPIGGNARRTLGGEASRSPRGASSTQGARSATVRVDQLLPSSSSSSSPPLLPPSLAPERLPSLPTRGRAPTVLLRLSRCCRRRCRRGPCGRPCASSPRRGSGRCPQSTARAAPALGRHHGAAARRGTGAPPIRGMATRRTPHSLLSSRPISLPEEPAAATTRTRTRTRRRRTTTTRTMRLLLFGPRDCASAASAWIPSAIVLAPAPPPPRGASLHAPLILPHIIHDNRQVADPSLRRQRMTGKEVEVRGRHAPHRSRRYPQAAGTRPRCFLGGDYVG